jgi:hypothetical protein
MSKQLTLEQKLNYMRLALSLQNIGLHEETVDSIVSTYDALLLKGGDLNLEDITQIAFDVKARHTKIIEDNATGGDHE